jgi:hypothetical protein
MDDKNARLDAILSGKETPSLYAILDEDARAWWANTTREKQRHSIREHLRVLKDGLANGGYATISQSGGVYTISYSDNAYIQGYGWRLVASAYLAGIPVLDFRPVESASAIVAMPMPVIGDSELKVRDVELDAKLRGNDPPQALDYVMLGTYLEMARRLGATLHRRSYG